jgi:hypothetical protein
VVVSYLGNGCREKGETNPNIGAHRIGTNAQTFWMLMTHVYIISCSDYLILRLSQAPILCRPAPSVAAKYRAWDSTP